jgi:hypothetical protein
MSEAGEVDGFVHVFRRSLALPAKSFTWRFWNLFLFDTATHLSSLRDWDFTIWIDGFLGDGQEKHVQRHERSGCVVMQQLLQAGLDSVRVAFPASLPTARPSAGVL